MNKAMRDGQKFRRSLACRIASCLVALTFLSGCKTLPTIPRSVQDFAPAYKPTNIYRRDATLPPQLKRVAVLPLTVTSVTPSLMSGVESLETILYAELEKTKRFEVIPVTPDQMRQWTGQNSWRSDEPLPFNIFVSIRKATGADAIMFCQLTRFQAYPPLAVGWKFSLVENPKNSAASTEVAKSQIVWSADEVLDDGDPAVANAARMYFTQHVHNDLPASDPSIMLSSPTRFGQYTLATLLDTLPPRSVQIH